MSGHSKWATIKHKKAALDAKRGKVFTKLLKEITVVAREGGDPASNPRLRTLIDKAKRVNMPQENLQRAIQKGTGELPGLMYEAQSYEGYGPGGIAVIVDTLTDNKNRAVSELRHLFSRHEGRLGETGSVRWMFEHLGVISVKAPQQTEDQMLELLFEYPITEITRDHDTFTITTDPKALDKVRTALQEQGLEVKSAELEWVATTKQTLSPEDETKAFAFLELLDELGDVQNVYSNV